MSTTSHRNQSGGNAGEQANPQRWINRLTVFGHSRELQETMRTRFGCQFETECSPIQSLQALSDRWPDLVLLLQWENETKRVIGLAKAKSGKLEQFQVRY